MKIIGIMLQRNEIDIVLYNALYHLRSVGFDRLIVGDNGSSDGSKEALQRLEKREPRLSVLDMPGEYQQAMRVNELYQIAIADGADWIIPLDADELLQTNRRLLEETLHRAAGAGVEMNIRNFVQSRRAKSRRMSGIASVLRAAKARGSSTEAYDLVSSGRIGFVEMTYPMKYIWRANRDLVIGKGNHGGENVDLNDISEAIVLNHIPLRSKSAIVERIQRIERLEPYDQGISWHIKRLANVDIDEEWRRNSARRGAVEVNGMRRRLSFDPFFLKVFLKYAFAVRELVRNFGE